MSGQPVSVAEQKRRWKALEDNDHDAIRATIALGMESEHTFRSWMRDFRRKLKTSGLTEPTEAFWDALGERDKPVAPADPPIAENLKLARAEQQNKQLRSENEELKRQLVARDDYRQSVLGLSRERLEPVSFHSKASAGKARAETAILLISDVHFGEYISREELNGLNAYDPEIATARLGRTFNVAAALLTKHWVGPPPERVIVALLGDMVSGALHPELERTDKMRPMESVRAVSGVLAGGIDVLLKAVKCPIDVISVVGNHGRTSFKPESKGVAVESYDTLVSDFLEMHYRGEKRVTFYVPPGPDALIGIYGYRILLTHGDRMSAGGGKGFIGPELPILRGFQKTHMDYAMRGIILNHIFCGHFHTALSSALGTANSCLPGPSEFSLSFRLRPSPPMQAFVTLHPEHFITQTRWIKPALPSEGALYEEPTAVQDIRPRFRVKAIGVAA